MKYHPRYIIFSVVKKYLTGEEIEKLKDEIGKSNLKQDRKFLSIIKKHFDLEILRSKPMIPEDVWIFNYLHFNLKSKFLKTGLIAKYEKEIIIPMEESFKEMRTNSGLNLN